MKKTIYLVIEGIAALAVVVLLVLWMSGAFNEKIEPGRVDVEVAVAPEGAATATVEESVVPVVEEAAGTVQAERKTVVSSRILAEIAEVRVAAGDVVEKGDVLIVLDDRELSARVREAEGAVRGAEATLSKARSDLQRARSLLGRGVVSQSEYDRAESAAKVAEAALQATVQAREAARVNSSYAEIRAPVSGRIVDRFADPGDTALPGKALLSLYDPAALRMEVPVRESLVSRISAGDALQVRLGDAAQPIEGTVDEVVPQAEAGSRTFLVKIGLPKREGMYTGMFGRALIPAGTRARVLVPAGAIEQIGQLRFARVVGEGRRLERRLVTTGPNAGDGQLEVLSGLRPGEVVLLP